MNKLFKNISILMLSAVLSFSITARADIDFITNLGPTDPNNITIGDFTGNGSTNVRSSILMGRSAAENAINMSEQVCLGSFTCVGANGISSGVNIGTGAGQTGTSSNTVLIGAFTGADVSTENGTALGPNAQIRVIGEGTARNANAWGANSIARADFATALGGGQANGIGSFSYGRSSLSSADSAISFLGTASGIGAISFIGNATSNGAVALRGNAGGENSLAILGSASADNGISIGGTTTVNGGVAIGFNTSNTGLNSATIGSFSSDNGQESVVSFGGFVPSLGTVLTRRLINVSNGLVNATSTDAVNGSQLFDTLLQANNYTDTAIANLNLGGGTPVDLNPLLARDGTRAMTGNLNLGGNQINNLQDGISASDASTVGQMQLYANSLVYQDDGVTAGQMFVTPDTAALVVTNSLGNTHGLTVGTDRTVLSGGTQSTSITLDDTGLTLSNITTGTARISGLSQGVLGTDAVNVDQLNAAIAGISGGGNPAEIRRLDGRVDDLEKQLRKVARKAYGGAALAMALQSATPPKPGEGIFGYGIGVFGGESAMGVSFSKASSSGNSVTSFGGGVTASGAFGFRGSVTFSWNPTSNKDEDKDADVEVKAAK